MNKIFSLTNTSVSLPSVSIDNLNTSFYILYNVYTCYLSVAVSVSLESFESDYSVHYKESCFLSISKKK